jgi:hypothetical protein
MRHFAHGLVFRAFPQSSEIQCAAMLLLPILDVLLDVPTPALCVENECIMLWDTRLDGLGAGSINNWHCMGVLGSEGMLGGAL